MKMGLAALFDMPWSCSSQHQKVALRTAPHRGAPSIYELSAVVVILTALILALGMGQAAAAEPGGARRIGYITGDTAALHRPFAKAFIDGLRDAGYEEGREVVILWNYAANDPTTLPRIASELVDAKVDVLVTDGTPISIAARGATNTIPIVVAASSDLVRAGLVDSLAHPGGNVTGLTLMSPDLTGKRLAVLKEMAPRTRRIGVVLNSDNPSNAFLLSEAQAAASLLGLKLRVIPVQRGQDAEQVLQSHARHVDALLVADDLMLDALRNTIGSFAIKNRLPSMCSFRLPHDTTCLMWYGPDLVEMFRQSADYVARILRGANPADLPVAQPSRLTLIINGGTAKALRLAVPPALQMAADEVTP